MDPEKIEQWFQKHFHNQPGFSDNTLVWNHLQQAKQDLLTITAPSAQKDKEE